MKNKDTFIIYMNCDWYNTKDIIEGANNQKYVIVKSLHKSWYKIIFMVITFGWYKPRIAYKCKLI